ncbi:uncharacterized protein LOC129939350 [Eupeodes corollae]|uniref:uncharacterized protein LOC129939350 n=1 Tax=Eupeodes corollae TaxID=290404 RepID=UPI002490A62B|nr:uncharacterized protein LOC129939350 [Eupeodes corollae]
MHIFESFGKSLNEMTSSYNEGYAMHVYDKTSCIETFTLINEVKKYPVLYNKNLPEYSNTSIKDKEKIWELIHAVLFPNYEQLSEGTKDIIKVTVRKRWKSMRDALVKDHRLRYESPEHRDKKMSATVKGMQFLLPYIKYPRIHTDSFDGKHSPDFCKLMNDTTIDLTFAEESEYSNVKIDDSDDDVITNDALYPSVHLTTSETGSDEVQWKDGFCISTTDAYSKSTLNYTIREVEEPVIVEPNETKKRKRSDSDEDLHSKLSSLVDRCNEESHDEDRMFLLSLLSDFKRVPIHKKLKVKSAFVTALFEALN